MDQLHVLALNERRTHVLHLTCLDFISPYNRGFGSKVSCRSDTFQNKPQFMIFFKTLKNSHPVTLILTLFFLPIVGGHFRRKDIQFICSLKKNNRYVPRTVHQVNASICTHHLT